MKKESAVVGTVSEHKTSSDNDSKERCHPGDLIISKGSFTPFLAIVLEYSPPQEGFSWSGDKGHYLMLDGKGQSSWYPAEYIHTISSKEITLRGYKKIK